MGERFVAPDGVGLNYEASGPPSAPGVVLLHGFPQSLRIWRFVGPRLAERYRVAAVDLRGYGDSDRPPGESAYDKRAMANDVRALVDHLGMERPLIVGHDRGARVARRYALDHPDALSGAALLDILPAEWVYDRLSAAEIAEKYWHWVFQVVPDLPEALVAGREEAYLARFFARSPGLLDRLRADGSWDAYLAAVRRPGAVAAMLDDYRATLHIDVPRYREERRQGRKVAAPLLLLWGSLGNLAGRPVLEAWREVADRVEGFEISDCGHYIPEEQPEEVLARLLPFAEGLLG